MDEESNDLKLQAKQELEETLRQLAPRLNRYPHDFLIRFKVTAPELTQLDEWTGDGNRSQVIRDRIFKPTAARDHLVQQLYPKLSQLQQSIATLITPENQADLTSLVQQVESIAALLWEKP